MNATRRKTLQAVLIVLAAGVGWRLLFVPPPDRSGTPLAQNTRDELQLGQLTLGACQIGSADGAGTAQAYCADYEVPENWNVAGGRRINLRLALVRSWAATPERDLVVFLDGGPGGAATADYPGYAAAFADLRRRHHLLLVDQRGTGGSNALACDSDIATAQGLGESDDRLDQTHLQQQLHACLQQLGSRADPHFYTTTMAVRDLEAVRQALGSPPLDLVGVSYGTRVAQRYAQTYPGSVRGVLLDSTVPNELALGGEHARNLEESLQQRFDICVRNSDCQRRFGDPYRSLMMLRDRLRAQPVTTRARDPVSYEIAERRVTAADLAGTVRLFSYSAVSAALLPLTIDEALKGNFAPLLGQQKLIYDSLSERLTGGVGLSVACAEDADLLPTRAGNESTLLGNSLIEFIQAGCSVWPRGDRPADFHAPFQSSLPVLLIAGQFDPVTPVRYGQQVVSLLPNGRLLILPGQGHAVLGVGCMPRLAATFVATLNAKKLDASCLDALGDVPAFLGYSGAAP